MAVRGITRFALLALLSFLLLGSAAWADSQARIVRLSYIDGEVQADRGDGPEYAVLNMPVVQGMSVGDPEGAHAEIEFENGSTIRLADYTQVRFEQLSLRTSGGKVNFLHIDFGTVYFRFRDVKDDDDIRITVGSRSFRVVKSSRFRFDVTEQNASLSVYDGRVELEGAPERVDVRKNETLRIELTGEQTYEVAHGIEQLPSDEWDHDRESERSAYARAHGPYDGYGAGELGHYGTYINTPMYGYVWRPFGMPIDWDPYGSGFWSAYSGCGYAWISPYSWGWVPYRYGSWVWLPDVGFAWWPGRSGFMWSSIDWNCGPRFYGYVPPTYVVPITPPRPPLRPIHGTRPPRVIVVGHPPTFPGGRKGAPGRSFGEGVLNNPGMKPVNPGLRGGTGPADPRPTQTLDDGDVVVRGRKVTMRPPAANPLGGKTTNTPVSPGQPTVRPADGVQPPNPPARRVDTPKPSTPPSDLGRQATTNTTPAPRASQPQPRAPQPSAPVHSSPPRVDSPARSNPAPSAPSHSSGGSFSAPSHSSPAPSAPSGGGHKK